MLQMLHFDNCVNVTNLSSIRPAPGQIARSSIFKEFTFAKISHLHTQQNINVLACDSTFYQLHYNIHISNSYQEGEEEEWGTGN